MPGGAATRLEAIVRTIGPAKCLTTAEIAGAIGIPNKQVATACCRLITGQIIERVEVGCFRLTAEGKKVARGERRLRSGPRSRLTGPRVPRPTTLRQRAWAAMRLSRRFTVGEIVTLAATAEETKAEAHLVKWFGLLVRAGYVALLPRRVPGTSPTSNGAKCWALLKDTGEIAPVIRPDGSVYDYNTGAGEPCASSGEAPPCSR
ncbi:hypothetical protein V5G24_00075 [Xanthobacter sp. VTT E-85241]|uniref:hypothetical protein n=1 Tax=Roseixanthobacter finlandensis TaxID=3119922 RepID=UPI00372C8EBB